MRTMCLILAVVIALLSPVASADDCSLSLKKADKKFLAKAQEGAHELDGRFCAKWDGTTASNLLLHTRDGKTHYRYSVLLSFGRRDHDGTVRWEVEGKEFSYGAGGDWRGYVTIEDDGLHAVMRDGNGNNRAEAVFKKHHTAGLTAD